jgi:hypothetical protein
MIPFLSTPIPIQMSLLLNSCNTFWSQHMHTMILMRTWKRIEEYDEEDDMLDLGDV